jgi:hypothetical protein
MTIEEFESKFFNNKEEECDWNEEIFCNL